eukprot:351343-Chlamydomonas_euryale.AAC.2
MATHADLTLCADSAQCADSGSCADSAPCADSLLTPQESLYIHTQTHGWDGVPRSGLCAVAAASFGLPGLRGAKRQARRWAVLALRRCFNERLCSRTLQAAVKLS